MWYKHAIISQEFCTNEINEKKNIFVLKGFAPSLNQINSICCFSNYNKTAVMKNNLDIV